MNLDTGTMATSVISAIVVGVFSSYLTLIRFNAKYTEREKHWERWREKIDIDIEILKKSMNLTELALLQQSLSSLIKRVDDLWKYATDLKHLIMDPYVRAVDVLNQRVEELERHKEDRR